MVLLRRTSVGCAVRTGLTRAVAKNLRKSAALKPAPRACNNVNASVPGGGVPPALERVRIWRMLFWVFGNVGKVGKITEGPHDAHGLAGRHAVEDEFELAPGGFIVIAVKTDRGLPDALDQIEHVGAFLIAHGVAEDAPKQPDVIPQPCVLFERQGFLGAAKLEVGVGRHDLG